MGYQRTIPIDLPPGQSAFLWGARQTGKSTLLRERFPDSVRYDLLDSEPLLRFTAMPSRLGAELQSLSLTDSRPGLDVHRSSWERRVLRTRGSRPQMGR